MFPLHSGVIGKTSIGQYNIFNIIKTLTPLPLVKIYIFIPQNISGGKCPPPQLRHCHYLPIQLIYCINLHYMCLLPITANYEKKNVLIHYPCNIEHKIPILYLSTIYYLFRPKYYYLLN